MDPFYGTYNVQMFLNKTIRKRYNQTSQIQNNSYVISISYFFLGSQWSLNQSRNHPLPTEPGSSLLHPQASNISEYHATTYTRTTTTTNTTTRPIPPFLQEQFQ
jgi:hypothetical protein